MCSRRSTDPNEPLIMEEIMARTSARAAKAAPAPEPEDTEEGAVTRGPGEMHEIFSEWLARETGVTVDPEHIYLVTSKRTAFRKSDEYAEYQEGKDALRDQAAKEKAARKKAEAETTEDEGDEETPAPKRATRGRRGKAVAETTEAAPEETPVATTGRRGRRAAAAPATEETEAASAPPRGRRGRRAAASEPAF